MKTDDELLSAITDAVDDLLCRYDAEKIWNYEIRLLDGEIDWYPEMNEGGYVVMDGECLFDQLSEVHYGEPGGWTKTDLREWVEVMVDPNGLSNIRARLRVPGDLATPKECVERAELLCSCLRAEYAEETAHDIVRRYLDLKGKLESWQEVREVCDDIGSILLEAEETLYFGSWPPASDDDETWGEPDDVDPVFFSICVHRHNEAWLARLIGDHYGREPEDIDFHDRNTYTAYFSV